MAACSSAPSANTVQTAIAETQAAQPSSTPIPTNTPSPTNTPLPTPTATQVPSPSQTLAPATSCTPVYLYLIDIEPTSGKGVFVTVDCSESNPDNLQDIILILPVGTPNSMIDEAMDYIFLSAVLGGWDIDDVATIYNLVSKDCAKELITSNELSGICIPVGQESTITSFLEIPKP